MNLNPSLPTQCIEFKRNNLETTFIPFKICCIGSGTAPCSTSPPGTTSGQPGRRQKRYMQQNVALIVKIIALIIDNIIR